MELYAAFLRFVTDYETEDRNLALAPLLKIVYDQFCPKFLGGDGIHTATYAEGPALLLDHMCCVAAQLQPVDHVLLLPSSVEAIQSIATGFVCVVPALCCRSFVCLTVTH